MNYVAYGLMVAGLTGASVGGFVSPDGIEAQCPLPGALHQKNTGGSDGAGLCVFASMRHTGRWQGDPAFDGLFDWMKSQPGGGYPAKVDAMLKRFCAEKGLAVPAYVQVEQTDLALLRLACGNHLMPCVTYGRSPTGRYGGRHISHMVSLVHADAERFAVLDNNYIGEVNIEWMTPAEFQKASTDGGGMWFIILLRQAPPPVPKTKR